MRRGVVEAAGKRTKYDLVYLKTWDKKQITRICSGRKSLLYFYTNEMSCHSRKTQIRQQENIMYLKEKNTVSFIIVVYSNFNYSQFRCASLAQMDLGMEAMQAQVLCFTLEARKPKQINFTLP